MKKSIYFLLGLIVFFSGCKNEEDLNPSQAILGLYQQTQVDYDEDLSFVKTIELNSENQVLYQGFFREKGESEVLGYQFYYEGTYTLDGDVVVMDFENTFQLLDPDITYVPKEDLVEVESEFYFEERYKVSDDYQELYYVCPPNALCIPPVPFIKIPPISG
ncbi:hypothetical protein JYB64_07705 [Algoriphagus aestuarii]|nr:hypothetical protein [Algoriphagus aestuarii]